MSRNILHHKYRRQQRVAASIGAGTKECPRVAVYRSLKYISAQVIDDERKHTLCAFSSAKLGGSKLLPLETAKATGLKLGELIKAQGLSRVVFDRRHYAYHGRVAALADGLREAGIKV